MTDYGTCPLFGGACVEPRNCGPAKLLADHQYTLDKATNSQATRPPEFCPVASVTSAIVTLSTLVTPLLLGAPPVEDEPPNEPEQSTRDKALKQIVIDQQ